MVLDSRHTQARDCLRLCDLNEAWKIVEVCLDQFRDAGNSAEIWSLRLTRSALLTLRGDAEAALGYLKSMETLYPPDSSDIPSLVGLKNQRGYCLGMLGKFSLAPPIVREAEGEARQAGLLELQYAVHQNQAMLFYFQEDYISSDRIFRLLLDEAGRVGGWYFRAVALWGIGKNLMIQEHHQAAMPWLEDSLRAFESAGARLWVATVWGELAVCYLGLGNDGKAQELFQGALDIEAEAGSVGNYQVHLANIGNVYLHRGNYLTAIDFYRRALALAQEIKDPVSIRKWSYNIRLAYARLCRSVDRLDSRTA